MIYCQEWTKSKWTLDHANATTCQVALMDPKRLVVQGYFTIEQKTAIIAIAWSNTTQA